MYEKSGAFFCTVKVSIHNYCETYIIYDFRAILSFRRFIRNRFVYKASMPLLTNVVQI